MEYLTLEEWEKIVDYQIDHNLAVLGKFLLWMY